MSVAVSHASKSREDIPLSDNEQCLQQFIGGKILNISSPSTVYDPRKMQIKRRGAVVPRLTIIALRDNCMGTTRRVFLWDSTAY